MTFAPTLDRFHAQTVLLFGSGMVAASLVRRLVSAGARVRWFSPDVDVAEELWLNSEPNRIEIAFRKPQALDFEEASAVIATGGEPIVFRLSEQARMAGCAVAVLGRPELSTFTLDEGRNGGPNGLPPPRPDATRCAPAGRLAVHIRRAGQVLSSLARFSAF